MKKLNKFYFTFGSWEKYPFQDTYIIVIAESINEAISTYRKYHPDIHENIINCSDYYYERQWEGGVSKHYEGKEPAEILWSDSLVVEKVKAAYIKKFPHLEGIKDNDKQFFNNVCRLVFAEGITPLELNRAITKVFGD